MKKTFIIFFLLLLLSASIAQNLTTTVTAESGSSLEILKDWRLLAFFAIFISVILVAIGYAVGIGFEMPEMEAWARSELTQVFANVIIIVALIATVTFIDIAVRAMVTGTDVVDCNYNENCLNKTANGYLEDYIESAKIGAKNTVDNNMAASAAASRRLGINCYVIYCAQLGITTTIAGQYMLDSDRYVIIFEYYTGILSSLNAQSFFINEICFKVGPLILALGIIARSFFVTRKLGGSLIAIAAGIMFFFPAMYIFDWMSLEMTLTGDNAIQASEISCPDECMQAVPVAYYYNTTLGKYISINKSTYVYDMFSDAESDKAKQILIGNKSSQTNADGIEVKSCQINSSKPWFKSDYYVSKEAQDTCDRSCRELPYPSGSGTCANYSMQLACSKIPVACKVTRIVSVIDQAQNASCPAECKIVPPMESNCNTGNCLKSRFDCRVAKINDTSWRPSIDKGLKGAEKCNTYPHDCVADLAAEKSCVWIMPLLGSCDDLCGSCPEECRFLNENDVSGVSSCFDPKGNYWSSCKTCPNTCKMNISEINAKGPSSSDTTNCSNCKANHRILPGYDVLPTDYTTDTTNYKCSLFSCPSDFRVYVPRSACESCVNVEEAYTYNPPINFNCVDLCKPPESKPVKKTGDYTKIGEDGLVGREEIKSVSKLMIPAYLLPLFNIAATIIVIRALAGMLEGDIEIPGLGKIF